MNNIDVNSILRNLRDNIYYDEYWYLHYSFNLAMTLEPIPAVDDVAMLRIPAKKYDKSLWDKKGVIVYTNNGSYAMSNQIYGGYSGGHKQFVNRAVIKAIEQELGDSVDYEIRFKY